MACYLARQFFKTGLRFFSTRYWVVVLTVSKLSLLICARCDSPTLLAASTLSPPSASHRLHRRASGRRYGLDDYHDSRSACLSFFLSICLSLCLSVCQSVSLYACLSVYIHNLLLCSCYKWNHCIKHD